MNIAYHAIVGVAGEMLLPQSRGRFFLMSVLPDLTLLWNEIKIRITRQPFDPWKVDAYSFCLYHAAHSIWVTFALYACVSPVFAVAHYIHIVSDWFTHTGRFAARPFFPFSNWEVPFGREILK